MKRTMKSISKSVKATCVVLLLSIASASANTTKALSFDWAPVMDAIIQVESKGDPNAVNGCWVGAMQISPVLVEDCNDILRNQKSSKRFTLADRYSVAKSKEMFLLIQQCYNPLNNVEKAIRIWNGGSRYSVKATNGYYKKVMAQMQEMGN